MQRLLVVVCDEVDGDTLTAETTGAADTVDVVLPVGREVVVDDEGDLRMNREGNEGGRGKEVEIRQEE